MDPGIPVDLTYEILPQQDTHSRVHDKLSCVDRYLRTLHVQVLERLVYECRNQPTAPTTDEVVLEGLDLHGRERRKTRAHWAERAALLIVLTPFFSSSMWPHSRLSRVKDKQETLRGLVTITEVQTLWCVFFFCCESWMCWKTLAEHGEYVLGDHSRSGFLRSMLRRARAVEETHVFVVVCCSTESPSAWEQGFVKHVNSVLPASPLTLRCTCQLFLRHCMCTTCSDAHFDYFRAAAVETA